MATSLMPQRSIPPVLEPSTDFPTLEDEEPIHRSRAWLVVLAAVLLVAMCTGFFFAGRASAPSAVPAACVTAMQDAEVGFVAGLAQLGTIEAGALTIVDGEYSEADSVLQDARLGRAELQRLHASFTEAAAACRAAG
jgi:hypothetical protein